MYKYVEATKDGQKVRKIIEGKTAIELLHKLQDYFAKKYSNQTRVLHEIRAAQTLYELGVAIDFAYGIGELTYQKGGIFRQIW